MLVVHLAYCYSVIFLEFLETNHSPAGDTDGSLMAGGSRDYFNRKVAKIGCTFPYAIPLPLPLLDHKKVTDSQVFVTVYRYLSISLAGGWTM